MEIVIDDGRSFINTENIRGSRTVSCGTPKLTVSSSEVGLIYFENSFSPHQRIRGSDSRTPFRVQNKSAPPHFCASTGLFTFSRKWQTVTYNAGKFVFLNFLHLTRKYFYYEENCICFEKMTGNIIFLENSNTLLSHTKHLKGLLINRIKSWRGSRFNSKEVYFYNNKTRQLVWDMKCQNVLSTLTRG